MSIKDSINKLKSAITVDVKELASQVIHENYQVLNELITKQLSGGIDGDGNNIMLIRSGKIKEDYSRITIKNKEEFGVGLGRVTDRITFYMSGNFYSTIGVVIKGTEFSLVGNVPYFHDIIKSTANGSKIMELNNENLSIFINEYFKPQLEYKIKQQIGYDNK